MKNQIITNFSFTNDLEENQELIVKIRNQNRNNFKEKNNVFSQNEGGS